MAEEAAPRRLTRRTWSSTLLNFKKMMVLRPDRWSEVRIGISSDNTLFIDCDLTSDVCRKAVLDILKEIHSVVQASLLVFRTERGMHVIPCATYFNRGLALDAVNGLRGVYKPKKRRGRTERAGTEWWVRRFGVRYPAEVEIDALAEAVDRTRSMLYIWEDAYTEIKTIPHSMCLDTLHIDISLQRHYTTLRAIPKPNKPMDIEFMGVYDGRLVAVTFDDVMENPTAYLRCRRFDRTALENAWRSYIQRNWIARGALIDMDVVNAMIRWIWVHLGVAT
jgi:hypothetical protein